MAALAAGVTVIAAAAVLYWNLPGTRADRAVSRARTYLGQMDYVQAEAAFSQALELDQHASEAYLGLARDYLSQEKQTEAEEILRQGYEITQEETLGREYLVTAMNGIVKKINAQTADLSDVEKCVSLLELWPENTELQKLAQNCYERILTQTDAEGINTVLLDGKEGDGSFSRYQALVSRLFALAEGSTEAGIRALAGRYALLDAKTAVSLSHVEAYREILKKGASYAADLQALPLGNTEGTDLAAEISQVLACLDKQAQISAQMEDLFTAFEAGDFEAAKDFLNGETYLEIRDAFIAGTMDYWSGSGYVPVTREAIVLEKKDGWQFSYLENDAYLVPGGCIRLLCGKMEDLGVQRSGVEYVPAYDPAHYLPHTEYEIVYWKTLVSGIATDTSQAVSRMNYRFAKKVYEENGMETEMIHDWGGPDETRYVHEKG